MTDQQINDYLTQLHTHGITPGLDSIVELTHRLGNPQDALRFIHIAGTNGKGSTLAFTSSILRAAGYRTGCFFSPGVSSHRECFQVNGRPITKADFARLLERIKGIADSITADGFPHPTAFEVDTALAFLFFKEQKVDIVVLETGMGGRHDATNIIPPPLVAVITPISIDHAEWLGDSLAEIAAHKAGIIKKGSLVISAKQDTVVEAEIKKKCKNNDCYAIVTPAKTLTRQKLMKPDYSKLLFHQTFSYGDMGDFTIRIAGEHQIDNAVLAIDTVALLDRHGYNIKTTDIRKGLREATWRGRFQLLAAKPPFIIDAAHNPAAARQMAATIQRYFTKKRIIYIMGVLADKDYRQMIVETHALADHIITVTPPSPRGLSSYELATEAASLHLAVTSADSIHEACELALLLADRNSIIVAFGSLTIIDEIMRFMKNTPRRGDRPRSPAHTRENIP